MKLYRAIVTKTKKGNVYLGKEFAFDVRGGLRQSIARDTGLTFDSALITFDNASSKLLEALKAEGFELVALVKANEFRLRDVVYYSKGDDNGR